MSGFWFMSQPTETVTNLDAFLWKLDSPSNIVFHCDLLYVIKCNLMSELDFSTITTILQCHMLFQKSFLYAILILKKHFFLSVLKTFLGFFDESSTELQLFEMEIFCNNMNIFIVTFNQFSISLLNKNITATRFFFTIILFFQNGAQMYFLVYLSGVVNACTK